MNRQLLLKLTAMIFFSQLPGMNGRSLQGAENGNHERIRNQADHAPSRILQQTEISSDFRAVFVLSEDFVPLSDDEDIVLQGLLPVMQEASETLLVTMNTLYEEMGIDRTITDVLVGDMTLGFIGNDGMFTTENPNQTNPPVETPVPTNPMNLNSTQRALQDLDFSGLFAVRVFLTVPGLCTGCSFDLGYTDQTNRLLQEESSSDLLDVDDIILGMNILLSDGSVSNEFGTIIGIAELEELDTASSSSRRSKKNSKKATTKAAKKAKSAKSPKSPKSSKRSRIFDVESLAAEIEGSNSTFASSKSAKVRTRLL